MRRSGLCRDLRNFKFSGLSLVICLRFIHGLQIDNFCVDQVFSFFKVNCYAGTIHRLNLSKTPVALCRMPDKRPGRYIVYHLRRLYSFTSNLH